MDKEMQTISKDLSSSPDLDAVSTTILKFTSHKFNLY